MRGALAIAVSLAVALAGCGGSAGKPHRLKVPKPALKTVPLPRSRFGAPSAADVAVIRSWADALRGGNVAAAARYFAVPSLFANGILANGQIPVIHIRSFADAFQVNLQLPCGARLVSARQHGPYVMALFRLSARPGPGGSSCGSGAGQTASTFFLIRGGKIVDWIRGPDTSQPPTGTSTQGGTATQPPTTTPGGGVPVA